MRFIKDVKVLVRPKDITKNSKWPHLVWKDVLGNKYLSPFVGDSSNVSQSSNTNSPLRVGQINHQF